LKAYAAHNADTHYRSFYLVTNEPALYHNTIQLTDDNEEMVLPEGTKNAFKFKITFNFGLVGGIFKNYFPQMYIWYENTEPYHWLCYEGKRRA